MTHNDRTTFDEFLTLVEAYHRQHPAHRYGQAVMNLLYSVRPDLYERAQHEHLDVFYTHDSAEVNATLAWLKQRFPYAAQ